MVGPLQSLGEPTARPVMSARAVYRKTSHKPAKNAVSRRSTKQKQINSFRNFNKGLQLNRVKKGEIQLKKVKDKSSNKKDNGGKHLLQPIKNCRGNFDEPALGSSVRNTDHEREIFNSSSQSSKKNLRISKQNELETDRKIKNIQSSYEKVMKAKSIACSTAKKQNTIEIRHSNNLLSSDILHKTSLKRVNVKLGNKRKRNLESSPTNLVDQLVSKKSKENKNSELHRKSTKEFDKLSELHGFNESHKDSTPFILRSSEELGAEILTWMISPIGKDEFFSSYWEKKALHVKRSTSSYYRHLLSTKALDKIFNTQNVQFGKNLDITVYKNGNRETHTPEGRALPTRVWDYYNTGHSVRFLNPQTFHRPVWKLLATLQEYFHSFCGANVYLTPPGSQGFAPHWDDIEAFILQLEGKKRWRVYAPRTECEVLPRESSGNFGPQDALGEPVLDVILMAGDLLYFPRGFIHQGETMTDAHSLHLTVSTYQKNAWVDFLDKLLPAALSAAAEENTEFRKGLPIGYAHTGGIAYSDLTSTAKDDFTKKAKELVTQMMEHAPIDAAIDQMFKSFIHASLPPVLEAEEKESSAFGGGEQWSADHKAVINRVEMKPDTSIRLLRKGCIRLVLEEDSVRLYYSVDNSRDYRAEEPKYLEIESDLAPAIEALIHSYPKFIKVENLPLEALEDKIILAVQLWERGLIITKFHMDKNSEDEDYRISS